MDKTYYSNLIDKSLQNGIFSRDEAREILSSEKIEILSLLHAAYEVRRTFVGKEVMVHILNNGQNGHCPEDCHYCAQAKSSEADIQEYPLKTDEEFLEEARIAYERGAYRYCMVFAGRGPSLKRVQYLADLIKKIKSRFPLEICVSAGLLDQEKADILKKAGLDRLNHNLNTSERHYPHICTTHTFHDRLNTLESAKGSGIELCSGIIVGMGETVEDIVEAAFLLKELAVISIPINFLIPIPGTILGNGGSLLTPGFCLRVICLFRFLNPKAEIRMAAGREFHLRSLEVLGLYAANSLFLDGYLNAKGEERKRTLQMIKDAGFTIKSDHTLEELLAKEDENQDATGILDGKNTIKNLHDLRPFCANKSKETNSCCSPQSS